MFLNRLFRGKRHFLCHPYWALNGGGNTVQLQWPVSRKMPLASRRVAGVHDDNALKMLVAEKGELVAVTQGRPEQLADRVKCLFDFSKG